jgi:hypothetical protein
MHAIPPERPDAQQIWGRHPPVQRNPGLWDALGAFGYKLKASGANSISIYLLKASLAFRKRIQKKDF